MSDADGFLVVGRVTDVYGLKGWVKVKSFTQPETNLLCYGQCYFESKGHWQLLTIDDGKPHGKGLIVKFAGFDDRTAAESLHGLKLSVKADVLPELDDGDYYWHQLEGLDVYVAGSSDEQCLGRIDHLLETGSNDVLVVRPCEGSIDKRERLLPYRPEVVLKVDLPASRIFVDWDIEF